MLMAAGLGTRLRPFTDLQPKALLPLMGVPMAQFALDSLRAAGVSRVVANVHHHAPAAIAGLHALDPEIAISDESAELLGSAGGLRKGAERFGNAPFFLMNADTLSDVDLPALAQTHRRLRAQRGVNLTLALLPRGRAAYREIGFADGLVTRLGEPVRGRPFFAGIAVIERAALADVPASGAADFVQTILLPQLALAKVGAHVLPDDAKFFDIGNPELWLEAHLALIAGLETGALPPLWRARLEGANVRVGDGVWTQRNTYRRVNRTQWAGPCYWDSLGVQIDQPKELGPRAVLYGRAPADRLIDGIGYREAWRGLDSNSDLA